MAAAELTRNPRARQACLPGKVRCVWARAFACVWALTLSSAGILTLAGSPARSTTRELLGLTLTAAHNPPPRVAAVLALAAHNIPIAAWPLLLGLRGPPRRQMTRRLVDALVIACAIANTVPVGAALGAYGAPLLAYVPQLPLEWAALALGYSSWLVQRRRPQGVGERAQSLAVIAGLLVCSAALEVYAVPHR